MYTEPDQENFDKINYKRPLSIPNGEHIHIGIPKCELERRSWLRCTIENNKYLCSIKKKNLTQINLENMCSYVRVSSPKLKIMCILCKIEILDQ